MSERTLLLNASYEPLGVMSAQRALILVLSGKAEMVEVDETEVFRSPSITLGVPVVIKLVKYVSVPYINYVGLTKRALYVRDKGKCQYCGSNKDLTTDHVLPRSKGGLNRWENVVLACGSCNRKKGSKLLSELGWTLKTPPVAPKGAAWRVVYHRNLDPRWNGYLV